MEILWRHPILQPSPPLLGWGRQRSQEWQYGIQFLKKEEWGREEEEGEKKRIIVSHNPSLFWLKINWIYSSQILSVLPMLVFGKWTPCLSWLINVFTAISSSVEEGEWERICVCMWQMAKVNPSQTFITKRYSVWKIYSQRNYCIRSRKVFLNLFIYLFIFIFTYSFVILDVP